MLKHRKGFKQFCFEIFAKAQVANIKIVAKPLIVAILVTNSAEYSKSDNRRNFSVPAQFLSFCYQEYVYSEK